MRFIAYYGFQFFLVPVWLTFRQDVELVFRVSARRLTDGEVSHERIKPDMGYVTRRVELSDISSNESRDSIYSRTRSMDYMTRVQLPRKD